MHDQEREEDDASRIPGKAESNKRVINDADMEGGDPGVMGDRAIAQFSTGTMRAQTNQAGTAGVTFQLEPQNSAVSSEFMYPETLTKAKHAVQDFWVYDGAHAGLTDRGSIATSRDQIMPNKRIREQDAIEWNRVGSKKGWMFNGTPQEKYGHPGENTPTHTSDGWTKSIQNHRWHPMERSVDRQMAAHHDLPAIDIENNARGIGSTGGGRSAGGGMTGGYQEVNKDRLKMLPIPMAKFNWTGTRLHGTGREDQGRQHGAGGYRAGYNSQYPIRPSFPERRTTGISRVTQAAA